MDKTYYVTVRDHHTQKIARQIEVDNDQVTIAEVIAEAIHRERVQQLLKRMKDNGCSDVRYFWFPELQPKPIPPPPPPEPITFDTLVNMNMV